VALGRLETLGIIKYTNLDISEFLINKNQMNIAELYNYKKSSNLCDSKENK
jgi:hypothetical protein